MILCATCEKAVDPSRRSTVMDHIKSMKHIKKKTRNEKIIAQLAQNGESAPKIVFRQASLNLLQVIMQEKKL